MGPAAASAATALERLLKDEEFSVRLAAAEALTKVRPGHSGAVKTIVEAVRKSVGDDSLAAVYAVAELGPPGKDAVRDLIRLLRVNLYEETEFRNACALAITRMGAAAVPALIAALGDKDEGHRMAVVVLLGRIGPQARPSVPKLLERLEDENGEVAWEAMQSVVAIMWPHAGD
jgi:HEAT repeat protein